MIKINLLGEKRAAKAKAATASAVNFKIETGQGSRTFLLVGILAVGVLVAGGWYLQRSSALSSLRNDLEAEREEAKRLVDIRKKADEFKKQRELVERKINLITELKKNQSVPVHILDQISRSLPDFLWLETMSATSNAVSIAGKATTYNAVSNFYDNLIASGRFTDVVMGKAAEVPEGVAFSLSCRYQQAPAEPAAPATAATPPAPAAPAASPQG
jgi:type IV pilus assembly protein PilN